MQWKPGSEPPNHSKNILMMEGKLMRVGYYDGKNSKYVLFHNGTGERRILDTVDLWRKAPLPRKEKAPDRKVQVIYKASFTESPAA